MARPRARRPISTAQLDELLDFVEERLRVEGCDHSLRHTIAFLGGRGFDVQAVAAWLRRAGGYCDCEVLMNVAD